AWVVDMVERPGGGGAEPEVPVEAFRHRHGTGGALACVHDVTEGRSLRLRLSSPGSVDPDVCLGHRTDGAGLDQLNNAPVVVARMDLGPHLGRRLRSPGGFANHARLPDVMCERLFAVNVLTE